jgi:putative flippase GtrA
MLRDPHVEKFIVTGIVSNIINFFTYTIIFFIEGLVVASIMGYLSGLTSSYYLGKRWVFKNETKISFIEVGSFILVYLIGGLIMTITIWLLNKEYLLNYQLSWFFGAFFAAINNFLGLKYVVFK